MKTELSPVDAGFWYIDSAATPQTIAAFCPLGGFPGKSAVEATIRDIAAVNPRLRERVRGSRELYWEEDPAFDPANQLDFQVSETIASCQDFLDAASGAFTRPFHPDHPPWRVTVWSAPASNAPWKAAFLFTFHHSLTDGLGGVMVLDQLLANSDGVRAAPRTNVGTASGAAETPQRRRSLRDIAGSGLRLARERLFTSQQPGLKGRNSGERIVSVAALPLANVKQMAKTRGCSVNDLYLAAAVSAAGDYLRERGETPGTARLILPVSTRNRSQRYDYGNHLLAVSLPVSLAALELSKRVEAIRKLTEGLKAGGSFAAYEGLASVAKLLPVFLKKRLANFLLSGADFICTNMPGPQGPRYFGGAPLLGMYGMPALVKSHGLAFSAMSCSGNLCLSVTSDPQIVTDGDRLVELLLARMSEAPFLDAHHAPAPV